MIDNRFAFGAVGGLGALAGADFFQHLIHATAVNPGRYAVHSSTRAFPVTVARRYGLRPDGSQAPRLQRDQPLGNAWRRRDPAALLH